MALRCVALALALRVKALALRVKALALALVAVALLTSLSLTCLVVVGVCFFLCRSTGDRDSDEFGQLVRSLVGAPGG